MRSVAVAIDHRRRYIAGMRWVLPLIFAVALAICAVDHGSVSARRRRRTALDGPAWMDPEAPAPPGDDDVTATEDRRPAARQAATFDAVTGILSWADDDERYN